MDLGLIFGLLTVAFLARLMAQVLRHEVPREIAPVLTAAVGAALLFALGDVLWRVSSANAGANWAALLVMWAGVMSVVPAWWLLALRFSELHGEAPRIARSRWARAPAIAQAAFYAALLTNPWHGQFLSLRPGRSDLHAIAWVHAAVTYATLLAALAVYARLALRARRQTTRAQARSMALGLAIPTGANAVYLAWPEPPAIDPTMVALAASSGALVYLVTRRRLFGLSPIAFSQVRAQDTDAVLLFDPQGRLVDANPVGRRLFGALLDEPEDGLARVAKALASSAGESGQAVAARLAAGISSPGDAFALERSPPRQLRVTTIALTGAGGRSAALLLRARDETELVEASARARERAAMLEAVFQAAGVGVAVLDNAGRVRFVNAQMERDFGLPASEVQGRRVADLLERSPVSQHVSRRLWEWQLEQLRSDPTATRRYDVTTRSGEVFAIVSVPLIENGVVTGRLHQHTNVTELRRRERAVQEAIRLDGLSDLAGGVAHDFNNLLTAVLGNAEIALLSLPPASPLRGPLEEVRGAAERGALLANQLLTYAGRARLRVGRVDLGVLIERELAVLAATKPAGVTLEHEVAPDLPAVRGDAAQLSGLIAILLRNAFEALAGRQGRVRVSARAEDGGVALRVSDTGVGMSPATLRRAFDPFFSTKPNAKGLGLAAARGIAAQHGGTIEATSEPDRGATFEVRLRADDDAGPDFAPAAAAGPREWRGSGRLLIVDDELATLRATRRLAESLGFEVDAFDRPGAALAAWRARPGAYRAALIDATMPECSGPELLRAVRRETPDARAVIYSGYMREAFELPESPPTGFLHKPFRRETLAEALRRVLGEAAS